MVKDALLKATPRGTPVCTFSVATNRFFKQDNDYAQETSFFDIETWSRLAENCGTLAQKGRGVRIVGRLKQDRWSDPEGKNLSRVKIIADHVEFRPIVKKNVEKDMVAESLETDEDIDEENENEEVKAREVVPVF